MVSARKSHAFVVSYFLSAYSYMSLSILTFSWCWYCPGDFSLLGKCHCEVKQLGICFAKNISEPFSYNYNIYFVNEQDNINIPFTIVISANIYSNCMKIH